MAQDDRTIKAIIDIVGYAMTCLPNNTDDWMHGLAEKIQAAANAVGDKSYFYFDGEQIRQRPAAAPVLKKGR